MNSFLKVKEFIECFDATVHSAVITLYRREKIRILSSWGEAIPMDLGESGGMPPLPEISVKLPALRLFLLQ